MEFAPNSERVGHVLQHFGAHYAIEYSGVDRDAIRRAGEVDRSAGAIVVARDDSRSVSEIRTVRLRSIRRWAM
jgi:hypothetical protein